MFETMGHKLKSLRINRGLSRKQVAELVGVTASMVGMYENGERLPSLSVLVKLATQYKVSVDYLVEHHTDSPDSLPLDGLTDRQVKALKMAADCFRDRSL